jgi:hypothetical protein
VVEVQAGTLEGGNAEKLYRAGTLKIISQRWFLGGSYRPANSSIIRRAVLMNVLKNFYLSAGLGYILNNIKDANIHRESNAINPTTGERYYTTGLNKSNELYLPARIGYEFKLFNQYDQPSFKIDLAAQYNMDFTDNMDGFNAGRSNDKMMQYSITFKFALGGVTSYRKQVN